MSLQPNPAASLQHKQKADSTLDIDSRWIIAFIVVRLERFIIIIVSEVVIRHDKPHSTHFQDTNENRFRWAAVALVCAIDLMYNFWARIVILLHREIACVYLFQ